MLIAFDIGNTNIVIAIFGGDILSPQQPVGGVMRLATNAARTADEYAANISVLLQNRGVNPQYISSAIISSVVPQANFEVSSYCKKYLSITPQIVDNSIANKFGMKIFIDNPNELGADRIVNAISAVDKYKKSAIIIDFGTATTFDVVRCSKEKKAEYLGGVIAPGIGLSLEALHKKAAKLPNIQIKKTDIAIGRNTTAAMQAGIFHGYVGLVQNIVSKIKSQMDDKPVVVATGGLAVLFEDNLSECLIDEIDDELNIRGLYLIAKG